MNDWGIAIAGVFFSVFGSWLVAKWTANKAIKNEMDKGVVLLWSLLKRYFISCYNCFHKTNGKVIQDDKTLHQHIRIISAIESELKELQYNHYYLHLVSNHANIEMMLVQLSIEIAHQEMMTANEFALNPGTIKYFHDVYKIIEKDIPSKAINEELKKIIDSIYSVASTLVIPPLKGD
jgi:hypothetical protein